MALPNSKPSLADLSLPVRFVLAAFLISVGLGYLSALVQLRVQHATNGQAMPSTEDVRRTFFGTEGKSQLERLLTADVSLPFNGSGSMKGAFVDPANTTGLDADVRGVLKKDKADHKDDPKHKEMARADAMELVLKWRDGERLAVLDWLKNGADKSAYADDSYSPSSDLAAELHINADDGHGGITEKFVDDSVAGTKTIKIRKILSSRCVRCHREGSGSAADEIPLDTYEDLACYMTPEKSGGMSLPKLAQSTHVHLLGFAVLWCLTGLIVACTGFPGWLRAVVAPWVLVAQVADIACWWLAGDNPQFADAIMITGGLVGVGLLAQLFMGLWDLFRGTGRFILFLVLILIGLGVARLYVKVVEPRFKNGVTSSSALQKAVSG
jgi:hypothetical protein